MKTRLLVILGTAMLPLGGWAQTNLIISGFTPNGLLSWSNAVPNSTCRVEWASSPLGPWTNTWDHLKAIPTGTNTQLSAFVPMFYRVVMTTPPPVPIYSINWCNVQWPPSADIQAGDPLTVYGQVYIAGLTDLTPGNDLAENVVVDFGYGLDGSNPDGNPGWVWVRGEPNPGHMFGNNDEYMGTFVVNEPGIYDYAARFSGDGGLTWVYTDFNGSSDGYQPANAGALTVTEL